MCLSFQKKKKQKKIIGFFPFRFVFCRYVCEEDWPKSEYNYYYSIALLVLQFVIPFFVLTFTYTRIAFAVWGKKPPGEAEDSRDQRMAKSKRKVILCVCVQIFQQINSKLNRQ